LKKCTKTLPDGLPANTTYNLEAAYNQMRHFTFNKLTDQDYVEKTVAEKEMKLFFLESENLPEDFIWHKPQRDYYHQAPANKDYTYHSHFNPKSNMIEVVTRKYLICVSLKVDNKAYIWAIAAIK
jgi:hypothetical protein